MLVYLMASMTVYATTCNMESTPPAPNSELNIRAWTINIKGFPNSVKE